MPERLAILVDGENVSPSYLASIINSLAQEPLQGYRHDIRRVFGDWSQGDLGPWRNIAESAGYRLVQVTRPINGKSLVDQGVTIDAMEIMANEDAEAICIVTTDTDFVPLIMRLRERHITTIVMADRRAHESLRASPHMFIELTATSTPAPEKVVAAPARVEDLLPDLIAAYEEVERNGKATLAAVGAALKKRRPDVVLKDYRDQKVTRFLDLVQHFPDAFQLLTEPKGDEPPIHYVAKRGK
jgi:hypothetical protein